jgi:hypothetical protein
MTTMYQQLQLITDDPAPYNTNTLANSGDSMKTYTKESLIQELRNIRKKGWIPNARPGNAGGVGNTLEDLLGIEENNLPIPNAAEWELKCQRANTASLTTLFHMEPSRVHSGLFLRCSCPNMVGLTKKLAKNTQATK